MPENQLVSHRFRICFYSSPIPFTDRRVGGENGAMRWAPHRLWIALSECRVYTYTGDEVVVVVGGRKATRNRWRVVYRWSNLMIIHFCSYSISSCANSGPNEDNTMYTSRSQPALDDFYFARLSDFGAVSSLSCLCQTETTSCLLLHR